MRKIEQKAYAKINLSLDILGRLENGYHIVKMVMQTIDLYDELAMPVELRRAHQQNDRAVMQAYGFNVKNMTESQCVAELFKLYQELTK